MTKIIYDLNRKPYYWMIDKHGVVEIIPVPQQEILEENDIVTRVDDELLLTIDGRLFVAKFGTNIREGFTRFQVYVADSYDPIETPEPISSYLISDSTNGEFHHQNFVFLQGRSGIIWLLHYYRRPNEEYITPSIVKTDLNFNLDGIISSDVKSLVGLDREGYLTSAVLQSESYFDPSPVIEVKRYLEQKFTLSGDFIGEDGTVYVIPFTTTGLLFDKEQLDEFPFQRFRFPHFVRDSKIYHLNTFYDLKKANFDSFYTVILKTSGDLLIYNNHIKEIVFEMRNVVDYWKISGSDYWADKPVGILINTDDDVLHYINLSYYNKENVKVSQKFEDYRLSLPTISRTKGSRL